MHHKPRFLTETHLNQRKSYYHRTQPLLTQPQFGFSKSESSCSTLLLFRQRFPLLLHSRGVSHVRLKLSYSAQSVGMRASLLRAATRCRRNLVGSHLLLGIAPHKAIRYGLYLLYQRRATRHHCWWGSDEHHKHPIFKATILRLEDA